jgi:hypothetical protein
VRGTTPPTHRDHKVTKKSDADHDEILGLKINDDDDDDDDNNNNNNIQTQTMRSLAWPPSLAARILRYSSHVPGAP